MSALTECEAASTERGNCTDFFENIANFRNLSVSLRRLQSKLPNPTAAGRPTTSYRFFCKDY
jgi:hypothetical protein